MNRKTRMARLLLLIPLSYALAGCGGSTVARNSPTPATVSPGKEHQGDHNHDQPHGADNGPIRTCVEAIQKVMALRAEIQAGFSMKDLDRADGPVHEIGHLLEDFQELAAKESLSDEQRETVKKSIHTLFEAFGTLDKTIHSGKGKSYVDLAGEIDGAIAALQATFPETSHKEREQ